MEIQAIKLTEGDLIKAATLLAESKQVALPKNIDNGKILWMAEIRAAKAERIAKEQRERYYASEHRMPPECDVLCRFRSCYIKYEDRGSYTAGRGYTAYRDGFTPACGTRLAEGCPDTRGRHDASDYNRGHVLEYMLVAVSKANSKFTKRTAEERRELAADMRDVERILQLWLVHAKGTNNET